MKIVQHIRNRTIRNIIKNTHKQCTYTTTTKIMEKPTIEDVYSKLYVSEHKLKENGTTGLYDIELLKEAEDVLKFEVIQKNKCNNLIEKIKATDVHSSDFNPDQFIDYADQLSNELCLFLDLAETIRNNHKSPKWVNTVNEAYDSLKLVMHHLNADKDLQQKIKTVNKIPTLKGEQKRVMERLMEDMEDVDGIENAEELSKVNQDLDQIQYNFVQQLQDIPSHIYIPKKGSFGFKKKKLSYRKGRELLRFSPDQIERKEVYLQLNTPSPEVKGLLKELQRTRQKKSDLLNYPTHNHLVLEQNVLTTPDEVVSFLDGVYEALQPQLEKELESYRHKRDQLDQQGLWKNGTNSDDIFVWDTEYIGAHMDHHTAASSSQCFSIHNAINGLTILCSEIFGIDLVPEPIKYGECFDPYIRKFSLQRDNNLLGHIYFDLFDRPNKPFEGVNFTIQVGRKASNQISRVVVTTSFPHKNAFPNMHSDSLTFAQLATLFHEFGHSMHAILGTTEYQVHSGFRTSVDFSEIPSHVLEHFLTNYDFVSRWAIDANNESIPRHTFYQMVASYNQDAKKILDDIIYARFDLELWNNPNDDPAHIFEQVHRHYSPFKAEYGNHFSTSSHLTNYGSMTYAYVYCQVVASQIYADQFENYAGNTNGPRYMDELLGPGGAIHSRDILMNYLGTVQPNPHQHIAFVNKFQ